VTAASPAAGADAGDGAPPLDGGTEPVEVVEVEVVELESGEEIVLVEGAEAGGE